MSQLLVDEPISVAVATLGRRQAPTASLSRAARGQTALLLLYTATLFVSSFLLFLVQPMVAKMVLPRLGGTPAVWNTCMLFFQACLLGGYLYAHWMPRILAARGQAILHLGLLALPLLFLPIRLPAHWLGEDPIYSLLAMLGVSVGAPFFVVSTTAPLLQKWFAASGHRTAGDPYFLYAASNIGSLIALIGYPILVEPWFPLAAQAVVWTYGYFLLLLLVCGCAAMTWRRAAIGGPHVEAMPEGCTAPGVLERLRWIVLAFVPSSYLLGVTTFMTTDIAAVPLFWVVPLALYLLSFILVFQKQRIQSSELMARMLPVALIGITLFLLVHAAQPVWLILLLHLAAFFVAAMVCHGELARRRPAAKHLTDFYLMMSIGGVLGGVFNALLAPTLFNRAYEYPIAIVLTCLVAPAATLKARISDLRFRISNLLSPIIMDLLLPLFVAGIAIVGSAMMPKWFGDRRAVGLLLGAGVPALACMTFRKRRWRFALGIVGLLIVSLLYVPGGGRVLSVRRSFFGVHRVVQSENGQFYELFHGTTIHGRQRVGNGFSAREPLTYYHRSGPAGDVFSRLPHRRVAVVGLGVGSLAGYANADTRMSFYEIDREVVWAAEGSGYFNFLAAARGRGANVDVILGDARLTLAAAPDAAYDLLILDAFSGDAVPAHLLTREAMALYFRKLAPSGVLAVHTSNVYLELKLVLAAAARDSGFAFLSRDDIDVSPSEMAEGKAASQWVVISRAPATLEPLAEGGKWHPYSGQHTRAWSDDFSDILSILRWRR